MVKPKPWKPDAKTLRWAAKELEKEFDTDAFRKDRPHEQFVWGMAKIITNLRMLASSIERKRRVK